MQNDENCCGWANNTDITATGECCKARPRKDFGCDPAKLPANPCKGPLLRKAEGHMTNIGVGLIATAVVELMSLCAAGQLRCTSK